MFVQEFVDVPVASDRVVGILTADDGELGVWASAAHLQDEGSNTESSGNGGSGVLFEQGTPIVGQDAVVIPIAWTATCSGVISRMEAEMVVSSMGREMSHVAFRGRYQTCPQGADVLPNKIALHDVAERTVRSFLERLNDAICSESPVETPDLGAI